MAPKTPYADLYKWDKTDTKLVTIQGAADNAEKIDTKLKSHNDSITAVEGRVTTAEGKVTTVDKRVDDVNTDITTKVKPDIANVKNQLDSIIIASGTSDAETVQARGTFPILKDRLNSVDEQLADIQTQFKNIDPALLDVIWVGDSTTDKNLGFATDNSPTYVLHEEFSSNFLKKGKPLEGARNVVYAQSGATTQQFIDNTVPGATNPVFTGIDDVITYCNTQGRQKQIIIYSLGHNDGIGTANWQYVVMPRHKKLIDRLLNETTALVVLRMPNAWASANGCVLSTAVDKTTSLKLMYLELEKIYKNRCAMINTQDVLGWTGGSQANKAWKSTTSFVMNDCVLSGGNVYRCKTAGTSGTVALSGTGTGIVDGSCVFDYESYVNPYMGDWTHPNAKGYQLIANVIGEYIVKLIGGFSKKGNFTKNKDDETYKTLFKTSVLKVTNNSILLDIDYSNRPRIKIGDLLYLQNGLVQKQITETTSLTGTEWTRKVSSAYSVGDYAVATFDDGDYLVLCMQTGTTNGNTSLGEMYTGKRDTNVVDGTCKWRVIRKAYTPLLITFSDAFVGYDTIFTYDTCEIKTLNTSSVDENAPISTGSIPNNNYFKICTFYFRKAYMTGTFSFLFSPNGSTKTNIYLVTINVYQDALNTVPTVEIKMRPLFTHNNWEVYPDNFTAVVNYDANGSNVVLYYKNTVGSSRYFNVNKCSLSKNTTSNVDVQFVLSRDLTPISALPSGTNVLGSYEQSIYLGTPTGNLRKITVNDSNVITVAPLA